jgi:hypothetical protein
VVVAEWGAAAMLPGMGFAYAMNIRIIPQKLSTFVNFPPSHSYLVRAIFIEALVKPHYHDSTTNGLNPSDADAVDNET